MIPLIIEEKKLQKAEKAAGDMPLLAEFWMELRRLVGLILEEVLVQVATIPEVVRMIIIVHDELAKEYETFKAWIYPR